MLARAPRWKASKFENPHREGAHDAVRVDLRAYLRAEFDTSWSKAEDWQRHEARLMIGAYYLGVAEQRLTMEDRDIAEYSERERATLTAPRTTGQQQDADDE